MLAKITVGTALNAGLDDHLGFDKHQNSLSENSRNGCPSKTLITEDWEISIDIPRDRESSFEPELITKHQRRFTSMDDKIHLYHFFGSRSNLLVIQPACLGLAPFNQ